jgi:hypothetical protein
MTDFNSDVTVGTETAEQAPQATETNWEEKYRSEVTERVRERERYKPIVQTLGSLHPDDTQAIQEFLGAFASGDTETATRWMIDNAKTLAGDRFSEYLSPQTQSNIAHQAINDGQQAGMSPQDVEKLIEQRLNQERQAQVQTQYEKQIEETLSQHGLDPNTPLATAAIVSASRRSDLDLTAAIREMEDQVLSQAQQIAAKRSQAGNQMATPIINGVSAINPNGQNMSPRERALARLEQNGI